VAKKARSTAITKGHAYRARVLRASPKCLAQDYDMPTDLAIYYSQQGRAVEAFFACTRAR
jgi:hypothetical protein